MGRGTRSRCLECVAQSASDAADLVASFVRPHSHRRVAGSLGFPGRAGGALHWIGRGRAAAPVRFRAMLQHAALGLARKDIRADDHRRRRLPSSPRWSRAAPGASARWPQNPAQAPQAAGRTRERRAGAPLTRCAHRSRGPAHLRVRLQPLREVAAAVVARLEPRLGPHKRHVRRRCERGTPRASQRTMRACRGGPRGVTSHVAKRGCSASE